MLQETGENIFYVYQLRVEDSESPFYVGKGKGRRAYKHEKIVGNNHLKNNIIKKAKEEGKSIVVEFLKENLCEDDAFMWEHFYIADYGRRDLSLGPLANLTDGGDGPSGIKRSPEKIQCEVCLRHMDPGNYKKSHGENCGKKTIKRIECEKCGKIVAVNMYAQWHGERCGSTISYMTTRNRKQGALNREKKTCEICGKKVDPGNYAQFHGERCGTTSSIYQTNKEECKYCHKLFTKAHLSQWHNEKCKEKKHVITDHTQKEL